MTLIIRRKWNSFGIRSFSSLMNSNEWRYNFLKNQPFPHIQTVVNEATALSALRAFDKNHEKIFAIDTETRGGGDSYLTFNGDVVCFTVYGGPDVDFGNGPYLYVDSAGLSSSMLNIFRSMLEDPQLKKTFHNYSYDSHAFYRHGITVRGLVGDTLHLSRVQDSSRGSWEGAAHQARMTSDIELKRLLREENEILRGPQEDEENVIQTDDIKAESGYSLKRLRVRMLGNIRAPFLEKSDDSIQVGSEKYDFSEKNHPQDLTEPEMMEKWVRYAVGDAWATFELYQELDKRFQVMPWMTEIGAEVIRDATQRSSADLHRAFKYRSQKLNLTLRSKAFDFTTADKQRQNNFLSDLTMDSPLISGSTSLKRETGMNFKSYTSRFMRPFTEVLVEMERRGVSIDKHEIDKIILEIHSERDRNLKDFREWLSVMSLPLKWGAINPYPNAQIADEFLVSSQNQIKQLVHGGHPNVPECPQVVQISVRNALYDIQKKKMDLARLEAASNLPSDVKPSRKTKILSEAAADAVPKDERVKAHKEVDLWGLGLAPSAKKSFRTSSGRPSVSHHALLDLVGNPRTASDVGGRAFDHLKLHLDSDEDAMDACMALYNLANGARLQRFAVTVGTLIPHIGDDERIHSSLLPDTATGRLCSKRPNLQNQPNGASDAFEVRSAFKAPPGKALVVADFDQLELRVLAHMSGAKSMVETFMKGGDLHAQTAVDLFEHVHEAVSRENLALSKVKGRFPNERNLAKTINFSIAYGSGANSIAERTGQTVESAKILLSKWRAARPEIGVYEKDIISKTKEFGYATSLLGRPRSLPFINATSNNALIAQSSRAALNHTIQGSAAELCGCAMLRIERDPIIQALGFKLVLQVHDECMLEGPIEFAVRASERVEFLMARPLGPLMNLRVPLPVDCAVGLTWLEAKGGGKPSKEISDLQASCLPEGVPEKDGEGDALGKYLLNRMSDEEKEFWYFGPLGDISKDFEEIPKREEGKRLSEVDEEEVIDKLFEAPKRVNRRLGLVVENKDSIVKKGSEEIKERKIKKGPQKC